MTGNTENALVVRMEATLARFERQMRRGRQVARETSTGIERDFANIERRIGRSTARSAQGLTGVMNVSRQSRFVLQNSIAQFGDMAVQLEQGTAMSRVLGQQLPQLAGGFGALGGALGTVVPLLGLLAGIGIPIGAFLLNMAGRSREAEEAVRTFAERLDAAEAATRRAGEAARMASAGGLADLRDRYGEVNEAIDNLVTRLADIERRGASTELQGLLDAALGGDFNAEIERFFGSVGGAIARATDEQVQAARDLVAALEAELSNLQALGQGDSFAATSLNQDLQLAREELAALTADMQNLGSLAGDLQISPDLLSDLDTLRDQARTLTQNGEFGAAADVFAEIESQLRAVANVAGADMTPALQATLDALAQAEDQARLYSNTMDAAADETGAAAARSADLAAALDRIAGSDISNVAEQATFIAERLGMAASEAARFVDTWSRVASLGAAVDPTLGGFEGNDPRNPNFNAPIFDGPTRTVNRFTPPSSPSSPSRGGGGGSGQSASSFLDAIRAQTAALQMQIDTIGLTRAETAALTAERTALTRAQQAGLDLDQQLAGSGRTLREEISLQAAEVGRLTEAYQEGQLRQQTFERNMRSIADAIAGAIVSGENLGDSLRQVFRQIATAWISNGLQRIFDTVGGGFGRGIGAGRGSLLGQIFGGFRANGGPVMAGRSYVVGENGPEVFSPPQTGTIIPNHALGGRSEVMIKLDVPEGVTVAQTRQIAGDVAVTVVAAGQQSQRRALPSTLSTVQERGV